MKKIFLVACCWFCFASLAMTVTCSFAQTIDQKLQKVFQQFEDDAQLSHAISSLYVIDAKIGKVVFDKNSQIGLAPASTQKIITSVSAFEILGKSYRYRTIFFLGPRNGLYVLGDGDPTFGSWRYQRTRDTAIFESVIKAFKNKGANIEKLIIMDNETLKNIPSGWIYEDIANYYGAAPKKINWHENQYDITFFPGKREGEGTEIDTSSTYGWNLFINNCKTGKAGSGDNAYVYFLPGEWKSVIEGTIPSGAKTFTISAADNRPNHTFSLLFMDFASSKNIFNGDKLSIESVATSNSNYLARKDTLYIHYSPPLDSIIYWFNKKSINFYGEALIKTFAYEKNGFGSTDSGVAIVKDFWKQKGIDEDELNISDGSGLSPQNRVTTHAQVEILKYAKTRDWFPSFYNSLPEYNGMKIKSGTIKGVKGFCGYHKARDGKGYIFSFPCNNCNR